MKKNNNTIGGGTYVEIIVDVVYGLGRAPPFLVGIELLHDGSTVFNNINRGESK